MSEILNWIKNNPELVKSIASTAPVIMGLRQQSNARDAQDEYLKQLEEAEKNRQQLINPYATVTNPYANLQVATKAAEMQAEQTDLALANTLDTLRQTGAGGATALAQAALKSKQDIASDIEKQEMTNQRLQAQGEQRAEQLRAAGQASIMGMQERREEAQLDRLQEMADIEAERAAMGTAAAIGGLGDIAGGLTGLIKPGENEQTIPEYTEPTRLQIRRNQKQIQKGKGMRPSFG